MNKDLVLKKGDRVEYKSHEQIKKLYIQIKKRKKSIKRKT